jgi:hypothetical protein
MAGMEGLGRLFDLSPDVVPVDISAGAKTGLLVSLKNCSGVSVVVFKGLEAGTDDPVLTFKESKTSSAGSKQSIANGVTKFYKKSAVTLAGTETWTKVTQAASATVTLTSEAANQGIYVIEFPASQLSDGFSYLSVDTGDAGSTAQLAGIMYILHDLSVQRTPANLAAALS